MCREVPDKEHLWHTGLPILLQVWGVNQPKHTVELFNACSAANDERMDIMNAADTTVLIRGMDETLTKTEEFPELVLMMDTTTQNNIPIYLIRALERVDVAGGLYCEHDRVVGLLC